MSMERTEVYGSGNDGELSAVLADYLVALDRGETPDRSALLERHPHLAERMRAFFTNQDRLDQLTSPLRPDPDGVDALGNYELIEEIGRGGMGTILRSRDRILNRDLALKVLLDRFRSRPDLVRRFVEEAQITGQLQHPFIVPVHELGTLPDGRPYFAMKLVKGRTFAELLAERTSPSQDLARFLKVFEQVCQTIAYAHSKDVIHRDLKPANVMVGEVRRGTTSWTGGSPRCWARCTERTPARAPAPAPRRASRQFVPTWRTTRRRPVRCSGRTRSCRRSRRTAGSN